MGVLLTRCAGIDVHKRAVVVRRVVLTDDGEWLRETRTDATTTDDPLRLSDWLTAGGGTHVGPERTGGYWKPVFNLLGGSGEVWLLDAQHIRAVPGRKTDVRDAGWIAGLLRHGLVRPSVIPPRHQRDLPGALWAMTRHRTAFVRERATLADRVQKVLEGTNRKLATVVTDVLGASGRAIRAALLAGEEDVTVRADLAKGKLREKRRYAAGRGRTTASCRPRCPPGSTGRTRRAPASTRRSLARARPTRGRESSRCWIRSPVSGAPWPNCWWPRSASTCADPRRRRASRPGPGWPPARTSAAAASAPARPARGTRG